MPPIIHVVVLNWNGLADTLECVRSLRGLDYPRYRVTVVDNGSSDGSASALRAAFPKLHVIENRRNLGFAEGNNVGIRHAMRVGADYVLLLNNDTVVDSRLLTELLAVAESFPDAGVIGPKIYYYSAPTRIWAAGGYWHEQEMCFEQVGDGEEDHGQFNEIRETEFVVGCAMFIPAPVLRRVGHLEPLYFLNYEEIDFCSRVHRAGLRNVFAPRAKLWHKVSASMGGDSSPLKIYFTFRNRLLWAERNLSFIRVLAIHRSVYAGAWKRYINPALAELRNPGHRIKRCLWAARSAWTSPMNRAWIYGVRDYWLRRFGPCPDSVWKMQTRWKQSRGQGAGSRYPLDGQAAMPKRQ